jgi:hypothetical protein
MISAVVVSSSAGGHGACRDEHCFSFWLCLVIAVFIKFSNMHEESKVSHLFEDCGTCCLDVSLREKKIHSIIGKN